MFFFHAPTTTEIYTLSLHDALPISKEVNGLSNPNNRPISELKATYIVFNGTADSSWGSLDLEKLQARCEALDRKSTRLNSSHGYISYAVFCLKKKKKKKNITQHTNT